MTMQRIVLIFCSLVAFISDAALAQDDFFLPQQQVESEITQEPLLETQGALPTAIPTQEAVDDFFGSAPQVDPKEQLTTEETLSQDKKNKHTSLSAEEDERAIPIHNIGLIVSADGSEKFKTYLQRLFEITRERPVMPGIVYLVLTGDDVSKTLGEAYAMINNTINLGVESDPEQIVKVLTNPHSLQDAMVKMQEQMKPGSDFARRLASAYSLMPVYEIPPMYPVHKLPTWYLVTSQGQIILEGLEDPSALITKSGKFVAPIAASEEKVVPTVTPAKSIS